MILVERPGPLTTIQDLGRPGFAALGVGPSGAADRGALIAANQLAGNPDGTAAFEVTLGGLVVVVERAAVAAVAGADCPLRLDGREIPRGGAIELPAGARLELGNAREGLRAYVAFRGGIDVEPVLGSRSTDTLAGLGPAKLQAGDRLPLGSASGSGDGVAAPAPVATGALTVLPGPRVDWFMAGSFEAFCSREWTVTPDSDRVGLRLSGPPLRRRIDAELPSEPMVRGAVQVPPDGMPVLLLADFPVTGGYPVIAVVLERDVDRAAQLRPGSSLAFKGKLPASS